MERSFFDILRYFFVNHLRVYLGFDSLRCDKTNFSEFDVNFQGS
jgi:hypothetical protein